MLPFNSASGTPIGLTRNVPPSPHNKRSGMAYALFMAGYTATYALDTTPPAARLSPAAAPPVYHEYGRHGCLQQAS
jgi:hypothetical protein